MTALVGAYFALKEKELNKRVDLKNKFGWNENLPIYYFASIILIFRSHGLKLLNFREFIKDTINELLKRNVYVLEPHADEFCVKVKNSDPQFYINFLNQTI